MSGAHTHEKVKLIFIKNFELNAEIYIQSAPNNSNETYILMCLGSARTASKFKYEIQIG